MVTVVDTAHSLLQHLRQNPMFRTRRVPAMIQQLCPLIHYFSGWDHETAAWYNAVDVVMVMVPVIWPTDWVYRHRCRGVKE